MKEIWLNSIIGVLATSLISLVGILVLVVSKRDLKRVISVLVALAGGVMMGEVFIHIIPEVAHEFGFGLEISLYFLVGILFFYILEEFLAWRHCHDIDCLEHPKKLALMNLVGDGFHNLTDGMIIAGSFLASTSLGIATTIAVAIHEIPQELGDFGILLCGGFSKRKAVLYNLLSGLVALLGMVFVLVIGGRFSGITKFVVPFTGGGFLYIVGSGIIPELHRRTENKMGRALAQFLVFVAGVLVMVFLRH